MLNYSLGEHSFRPRSYRIPGLSKFIPRYKTIENFAKMSRYKFIIQIYNKLQGINSRIDKAKISAPMSIAIRYARCNGNRERNKIQKYQQGFL